MRERQAAQLAAAFILKAGQALDLVTLMKLMYLAEREAMRRFVFPIVFDDIHAMEAGMVLSTTFDLMKGKPGTPTTGEWAEHIAPPSYRGINVRRGVGPSGLDGLSPNDLEVVDCVWARYGRKDRDELVHEIHHSLAEWVANWEVPNRRQRSVLVPYGQLLETIRGSRDDADEVTGAVEHFRLSPDSAELRPNAETMQAIHAVRCGDVKTVATPAEAIAELNAEDRSQY